MRDDSGLSPPVAGRPKQWLGGSAGAIRDHLAVGNRSIWATGLLVTLLSWPVGIGTPAAGLDSSWLAGLYLAAHDGKAFGSEIVFTYGPLGFLSWPQLWFGWLAVLAYIYVSVVYLAFVLHAHLGAQAEHRAVGRRRW